MSYRFSLSDESVADGVRRIATERIVDAMAALQPAEAPSATTVHEVRKRCKELRALVQIIRPAFPDARREDRAFRDIARLLSQQRDATVMLETFEVLVRGTAAPPPDELVGDVRAALRVRCRDAGDSATAAKAVGAEALARLRDARERAAVWSFESGGWSALAPGFCDTYRRARKAMETALPEADGAAMHEWRKHAKAHEHHLKLLRDTWPRVIKRQADEANRLTEFLGDHHDITVLLSHLEQTPEAFGGSAAAGAILALGEARQAVLAEDARRLGARLFAEKPGAFGRRYERYFKAWRREGRREDAAPGRAAAA